MIGLIVVAVILVIVRVVTGIMGSPGAAGVGDCLAGRTADDLKAVDCADAAARYKVLGEVDGKTRDDFEANSREICRPYQGTTTALWRGGEKLEIGHVLCLAPNR